MDINTSPREVISKVSANLLQRIKSSVSAACAMMFRTTCLVLVAVTIVQCANVPTEKLTNVVQSDAFPGRNISPGQQCRNRHRDGYGGVCKTDDPAKRCAELICAETEDYDIPTPIETGPALDGTWCGDKKICYKGTCIDDTQSPETPLKITDFQYGCEKWWE